MIKDTCQIIHEDLKNRFDSLLDCEPILRYILYDVLSMGGAYIIGGFVRDVLNGKDNRDLDIIVDVPQKELKHILKSNNCEEYVNRLGGAKLKLEHLEIDIWSIHNNWAFAQNIVKLNDNDKLNSIAKGCFYNYDALVVSVPKFMYNTRYYYEFVNKKELDIIQKQTIYQKLNPTVEANIIRASYIKKMHNISFSKNLNDYLTNEILSLHDKYGNAFQRLLSIKSLYSKYDVVLEKDIKLMIEELLDNRRPSLFDKDDYSEIIN